jgi:hypothetical protein
VQLAGLKWRFQGDGSDTVLVDTRLPFGARASCEVFNRLSAAIRRRMLCQGFRATVNFLDDWAVAGATLEAVERAFNYLVSLLKCLGFTINQGKTTAPCQRLVFLGVEVDTREGTMSLPKENAWRR